MGWKVKGDEGEASGDKPLPNPLPRFGLPDEEIASVFNENYNQLRDLTMKAIATNPAHPEKVAAANTMALVGTIYELFRKNNEAIYQQVTEYIDKRLSDGQQAP
jgi:hypothetical protein